MKEMKNLWTNVDNAMEKETNNCEDYGGTLYGNINLNPNCEGLPDTNIIFIKSDSEEIPTTVKPSKANKLLKNGKLAPISFFINPLFRQMDRHDNFNSELLIKPAFRSLLSYLIYHKSSGCAFGSL